MAVNVKSPIYDIKVTDLSGRQFKLEELKGNVVLIVNVASKCGLAQQSYQELASLLVKYHSKGLRILIFPCQQFLKQEFDQLEKINEFARSFSDKFMIMKPVDVKGKNIHPLFKYLIDNLHGFLTNDIKWNFTYFLIGRNGELVRRYGPTERLPDTDKDLVKCIGNVEDVPDKTNTKNICVDFKDEE